MCQDRISVKIKRVNFHAVERLQKSDRLFTREIEVFQITLMDFHVTKKSAEK